ncbi:MAG: hypothetical protein IJS15_08510, partial [Victivallales bacterium]|nr:hypothetical protein [Victivallales bacterium]
MPVEFLNVLCANYIPYAIMRLGNVSALAGAASLMQDKLTVNALVGLSDFSLLSGDAAGAATLISRLDESQRLPRMAFLDFMGHRMDSALSLFEEFLGKAGDAHAKEFFNSQYGIVYVFCLIAVGDYAKAREMAERGIDAGKMIASYSRLSKSVGHFMGLSDEKARPENSQSDKCALFEQFVVQVCDFAEGVEHEGDLEMMRRLESLTTGVYSTLEDDCMLMLSYASLRHSCDDMTARPHLFLDCMHIRPLWERDVDSLLAIAEARMTTERLVWLCRDNPASRCRVLMYPYEQKMSKSGNWSSGAKFPILNTVESGNWPPFLTLQDQMMCKIIAEEARAKGLTTLDSAGVASPKVIEAAVGHPGLYWIRDNKRVKFSCRSVKPIIRVWNADGNVGLSMVTSSDDSIVASVDNNDDVAVCHYSEQQIRIASGLSRGLTVPAVYAEKLHRLLAALAWNFNIISECPLDFIRIPTCVSESEFHLRLRPTDDRMWVELLVSPFNGVNGLEYPGEGNREIICIKEGTPTRFVRDFEEELRTAEEIVSECAIIS